ncbi:hypothetical protein HPP92_017201 [Vanilla planifolia]|uniref:Piezo non-specific cation channel R-Ras-binding domain-containing protein n=1 Tax=Vanilla planifolia TaxID=51239 RepID=A0A835USW5_VANPL|nr:hypothetical protein HPP92_017201 [Vanilla planifolia]
MLFTCVSFCFTCWAIPLLEKIRKALILFCGAHFSLLYLLQLDLISRLLEQSGSFTISFLSQIGIRSHTSSRDFIEITVLLCFCTIQHHGFKMLVSFSSIVQHARHPPFGFSILKAGLNKSVLLSVYASHRVSDGPSTSTSHEKLIASYLSKVGQRCLSFYRSYGTYVAFMTILLTLYLVKPNYKSFGYLFFLLVWIIGRQLVEKTRRRLWFPLKIYATIVFILTYALSISTSIETWLSKWIDLYDYLGYALESSLLVNIWESLAILIVMQLYSYERWQSQYARTSEITDASENGCLRFMRRLIIWHCEKILSTAVFYASLSPISAFGFLYLLSLIVCSTLPKTSRVPSKFFLLYTGFLMTSEYLFQLWGKEAYMFPGQKLYDLSLFMGFRVFKTGFWGIEYGLRGKVIVIVACTLQYNVFHWLEKMPYSLVNNTKWEEPCQLFFSTEHDAMATFCHDNEKTVFAGSIFSLKKGVATKSLPSLNSKNQETSDPQPSIRSSVTSNKRSSLWGSSKESHKWNKKIILALKKERLELQKTTLIIYMKFWIENIFRLHGLEINMIVLLVASFTALNAISMFYIACLVMFIFLKRDAIKKSWPIFVLAFAAILALEYFALLKNLIPWIHPPTDTDVHCHDCWSSSSLHFDYCTKCWLDHLDGFSESHAYHQMISQRKNASVWRDLSFETKSFWTFLDYLREFEYVARYLEAEQIGAMVREQEKRAARKAAQLQDTLKSEEEKHQRNLQVEKMKSEMLNLQSQLKSMNSVRDSFDLSPRNEGLRHRKCFSNSGMDHDCRSTMQAQDIDGELESSFNFPVPHPLKNISLTSVTSEPEDSPQSGRSHGSLTVDCQKISTVSAPEISELPERLQDNETCQDNRRKMKGTENPLVSAVQLLGDGVSQVQSLGNQAVTNIASFLNIKPEDNESTDQTLDDGIYDEVESQESASCGYMGRSSSVCSYSDTAPPAGQQLRKILHYIWSQMRSNNDVFERQVSTVVLTSGELCDEISKKLSKVINWPEDGIQPQKIESGINHLLRIAHEDRCQANIQNSCHSTSRVRIQSIERSPESADVALAILEVVYAAPLVGCPALETYWSLTPALDVATELRMAQSAGTFDEIGFPYPVISVIGGGKKEVDLYAYIFGADLAVFFLVAILYQSVIKNINKLLDVYQLEDQFPKEFVFILMVLFFLIVVDRIIYLCSFATVKVILYLFNLFLFTYSVTEYTWRMEPSHKRIGGLALRAIYLTKAVSLALQALQIRYGIPNKSTLYRQFLTSKVSQINYLGFRLYRALPFLYELRCVLDWSCTTTSLTMYDWLKLEDIYSSLFLVKCDAVLNRASHKLGQKQSKMTKFCSGICLFFILICVIWAPMLMYSSGNPTNIANPIKDVSVQIDIKSDGGRLTPFQTTMCEIPQYRYLDFLDNSDQHYLEAYNLQDIQLICCQSDARKEAVKAESLVEQPPSPDEVILVLNGSARSLRLLNAFPRYFRVTSSGEVRRLEQTLSSVGGDLFLNHGSQPWWSFHDANASEIAGCNGMSGPIAIVVSEETPQGILGETLSKFNIWSLYITFVLAVGRFIRLQCSDLRMRIPFENLPTCDRLIAICEDIYAARAEGELEVEEVLYWTLVKIYRSPHMLLEYTKPD